MKRILLAAGVASAALVTAGLTAPAALADGQNATCTSTLPPGTYQNVTVPAQANCTIDGSDIITGNVTVATGATLLDSGAPIGGNLQADHAGTVDVDSSASGAAGSIGGNLLLTATSGLNLVCAVTVGNNVIVQNSAASSDSSIGPLHGCVFTNTIKGNLTVQDNAGSVGVAFNTVAGNISVHNNTGSGLGVFSNSAGGNCQLFNDNPPLPGFGNSVPPGHQNTCNRPG
jgi:hypothetical protein